MTHESQQRLFGLMRRRRPTDLGDMDNHLPADSSPRALRRHVYQNIVLTAIAGLLALGLMDRTSGQPGLVSRVMGPASASAQSDGGGELANALQQRKDIISEIHQLNAKIDRIEAKLSQGINVKVLDMPALKLPPELRSESVKSSAKSDKPKDPPAINVKVTPER